EHSDARHDIPHPGRVLKCVVVTPEKAVLDQEADFVALPMYDGELGVLPGRAPLIGRLGIGELRIRNGPDTNHLFIEGGFAQVRNNIVTVLTPRALKAADINPDIVAQSLSAPKEPATDPATRDARQKAEQSRRAQLMVARRAREDK